MMPPVPFDRRRTPARPDLAAWHLRDRIAAPRYERARMMRIVEEAAAVRARPAPDAPLETQALFGETVAVYEDEEGWVWGQLNRDGYVGWLSAASLAGDGGPATHRVAVPRTFVYPGLSMKLPVVMGLPLGADVEVVARHGEFSEVRNLGCVWSAHLAPLGAAATDFVGVAERILNVPYMWGGKTALGLDCSELVQIALQAAGVAAPRDTDMQASELGHGLTDGEPPQRGDLIFWKGHVGIMQDRVRLLHANGHHMIVASEPLDEAVARILAASGGPVMAVRRLEPSAATG